MSPEADNAEPVSAVDSTRELVHRVSLELFSRLGFNATGMRLIAQESGVSVATVYHYIKSKDELLKDILRQNISGLLAEASRELLKVESRTEELRALVRVHVATHATDREMCLLSDRELRSLPQAAQTEIIGLRDEYEALWRDTLSVGRSEDVFTFEDLTITAHALLEMCTGVVHWFSPEGRLSVDEVVDLHQILSLRLLGIESRSVT